MKRIFLVIVFLFMSVIYSYADPVTIGEGKTVKFDYTLTVDGQVADTSEGKEPLEYTHGSQMIIPGLELKMTGLKVGDKKTIMVKPAEAYGEVDPRAIIEVPKEQLGPNINPQLGAVLQLQTGTGQPLNGVIQEVKDTTVVINFNHPLAGKELKFDINIVSIQ